MSRGKSVAQGAGESARHGLIPRSDAGSALPEGNTLYLRYLSADGCRFRIADDLPRNFNDGLTFWTRSPGNSNNSARGLRQSPTPSVGHYFH